MVSAKQAIRWWNSSILLALVFFSISCKLTSPFLPVVACTLIGCVGGINIEFSNLPPGAEYEVNLILPSGEKINLQCGSNTNEIPFEKNCTESGAFFALPLDVDPPPEIVIEVIVDGITSSQEFAPVYEKFQPNGEDCPPVCYNATVQFQFSQ